MTGEAATRTTLGQRLLRRVVLRLLHLSFRLYYRRISVSGLHLVPDEGPVLLVANHPNSLLDPAILVHISPRPLFFGAKHTLFRSKILGGVLRAFGCIPLVRASDDPRNVRKNLAAFDHYAEYLRAGKITAIFPEGLSQDEMSLAPIKSGAARIALAAESASDFELGLSIHPVGLQFHPRRSFRADAIVRFGNPISVPELAELHRENPRRAVRELTERIDHALKQVALHMAHPEQRPLALRLADVYWVRACATGLGAEQRRALKGDLLHHITQSLNHFNEQDPALVAEVEGALRRYENLCDEAGIDCTLLEQPMRLLPGPLGAVQIVAEASIGAIPALFGFLTSAPPYFLVKHFSLRRARRKEGNGVTLSVAHVVGGLVVFPLWYALLIWDADQRYPEVVTLIFGLLLIPAGLFARAYIQRMRSLIAHFGRRSSAWFRLERVRRVREARDEVLAIMHRARNRYRCDVLGLEELPDDFQR